MVSDLKKNITVLSTSFRSGEHLSRLFDNLRMKAGNPQALQFVVVDNTNGQDEELKGLFSNDIEIQFVMNDGLGLQRSISHANALDHGIKNCKTDFTLIIDPDVHVFKQDWDNFCIDKMNQFDKMVIGAPYPEWKLGKEHDYPSVIFMFFRTEQLLKFERSFNPFPSLGRKIINSFLRKITRLGLLTSKTKLDNSKRLRTISAWLENLTGITSPDTGKDIIESLRNEGFDALNFYACYSTDIADKAEISKTELAKQFELYYYNDEIMITHMYGSGVFHWKTERGNDLVYWKELISKIEKKSQ